MSDNFWRKISYLTGLLPLGAIAGFVFYTAHLEIKDLDLWLHIGMGRYIAQTLSIPSVDVLSCTIAGSPWINHEWLFQVIVYHIHRLWGPDGLIQMQVVIVTMTMLLLLFLGYNKDKQLILAFVLFLVSLVYHERFTIRPDIYSLFFFTFYIFVLALHIDKKWAPAALFFVQVLWSNIHGFFFFGPLFVLIGVFSEWLKRRVRLPYEWNGSGRLTDEEYGRLKAILALVILACLFNPSTFKGAWYPIGVFFSLSGENKIFFQYIQELQKPVTGQTLLDTGRFGYYKLLILISVLSFIFNRRRIDVSALFFWLIFLIFSLQAARNMAFFALASYLVIMTNFMNVSYKDVVPLRFTEKKFMYLTSTAVKLLFLIWIFQLTAEAAGRRYYDFDAYEYKSEYGGVSQNSFPDKAVDFLVKNDIRGNFFNDFNSGAYLVGNAFPGIKVFIDGRTEVYGGKFFERYQKIWDRGETQLLEPMVQQHHITGALLNSSRQHIPREILNYFYRHPEWVPVYLNYDGVVFLRKVSENQKHIDRFALDLTRWEVPLLDLPKIGATAISPFQYYYRAFTLESLDMYDAALAEALEAVKITPGYGKIHDLIGKIYAKRKDYQEAFPHFRTAVINDPHDEKARHNFALCYFDMGDYEGAVKQYNGIIADWPSDPKAYFLLAKTYVKAERYGEALKTAEKAHQLRPDDARDILELGDAVYAQGQYETAKDMYALAVKTQKEPAVVYKKLGLVYKKLGRAEEAAESFKKSLSIDPLDNEVKKELE